MSGVSDILTVFGPLIEPSGFGQAGNRSGFSGAIQTPRTALRR
jgi:hypothetical protein